jgi:AraC-like DNA-binding protein
LSIEQGGILKHLLQQTGQIQQISKAVEYIHQNLDKSISIDDLASVVNMSNSGFHKKFKEVMHLSPMYYTESIKLNKTRSLILGEIDVSESGYLVGDNSPAQFSREYKRYFGYVLSAI